MTGGWWNAGEDAKLIRLIKTLDAEMYISRVFYFLSLLCRFFYYNLDSKYFIFAIAFE